MSERSENSPLNKLLAHRSRLKCSLERISSFVQQFDTSENDLDTIEIRQEILKDVAVKFDKVQTLIEEIVENDSQDRHRIEFEEFYFKLLARVKKLLKPPSVVTPAAQDRQQPKTISKLPNLNIKKFDGTHSKWQSFFNNFNNFVHGNENLSDIQKLHILKSCTEGSALDLIGTIKITTENYHLAFKLLCDKFQNKRVIVKTHLNGILNYPKLNRQSASALSQLYIDMVKHVKSLADLGLPTQHWGPILAHVISQKFDPQTFRQWEDQSSSREFPTFCALEEFLRGKCSSLEYPTTLNEDADARKKIRTRASIKII